jgi:ankyrin repeat protein
VDRSARIGDKMLHTVAAVLALMLLLPFKGWSETPEDARIKARKELGQLGLQYNWQSFVASLQNNDTVAVDLFLAAGMSTEVEDPMRGTPLMYFASRGNVEAMRLLVNKGANVNAQTSKGWTVLMHGIGEQRSRKPG